ncbi:16S rRNA processing protein RimM [bacterium]|nr:16S rRNA processing protein RimM [bacterium]
MKDYISIGKITNFFGIKGEAKVGYSNLAQLKGAKIVHLLDNIEPVELEIERIREGKNFAIVKFKGIDDINDLIQFKGQRLFVSKKEALNRLDDNEYLINDLINFTVYNEKQEKIGKVVNISTNGTQDLLNIENSLHQVKLVPFVNEFFPVVDVQNKKIIIKPIEGLL